MNYTRLYLWTFRLALPLWALNMLVPLGQLHWLTQSLLLSALLLALKAPLDKWGRLWVGLAIVTTLARYLGLMPPGSYMLPPEHHWIITGQTPTWTTWGFRLLEQGFRWFLNPKNWLPMTIPVMALAFAASRLARALNSDLDRSLRRLSFAPLTLYLAALLGMLLALGLAWMSHAPSGLIALFGGLILVGPLVALAGLFWLFRLNGQLGKLIPLCPANPPWLALLAVLPLAMVTLKVCNFIRVRNYTPPPRHSNYDFRKDIYSKVEQVDWNRVDGRLALEVGWIQCSADSGSLGVSDAVSAELKKHAQKSKAGQMWLFYKSDGKLRAKGLVAAEGMNGYNDLLNPESPMSRRLDEIPPDNLAVVAHKQATEPLDLGTCLAWESTASTPVEISLWVHWPKPPQQSQLLRRCQLEALKYHQAPLRCIRLHSGTGTPSNWKPTSSVVYRWDDSKPGRWYTTPQDSKRWTLASCPTQPLTALSRRKHEYFARRPLPKRKQDPSFDTLCQGRRDLLVQGIMQFQRDQRRWPASVWEVVPDYLSTLPACPYNENWEYAYEFDAKQRGCKVQCLCQSHYHLTRERGPGPYTDSRLGRNPYANGQPTPAPELQECLKQPRGWLKQFESSLKMQ